LNNVDPDLKAASRAIDGRQVPKGADLSLYKIHSSGISRLSLEPPALGLFALLLIAGVAVRREGGGGQKNAGVVKKGGVGIGGAKGTRWRLL
jgi:hypothetical protein